MPIVCMYTAGLRQPAVHLSTLFPKQKPGQDTPLILLVHTLVFFPWKTRQRGFGGGVRLLVQQAVQWQPEHAPKLKASWDSSRNSELVLILSARTLVSLLAQLLNRIMFCNHTVIFFVGYMIQILDL